MACEIYYREEKTVHSGTVSFLKASLCLIDENFLMNHQVILELTQHPLALLTVQVIFY